MIKNLSDLQKRLIGACGLFMIGVLFFWDILNRQNNFISTGISLLFSFGVLYELVSLFFKKTSPITLKKIFFFALSFLIYVPACYFIFTLSKTEAGILLLPILLITILTDTGAYFIGKNFGKHKLAPSISPNKTWEGALGGIIVSVFFIGLITYGLSINHNLNLPLFSINFVIGISLLSSFVQIGDLFESYIKRLNQKKDSGTLVFGHGGLLDRFDGFLFLVFCIFLLILFEGGFQ